MKRSLLRLHCTFVAKCASCNCTHGCARLLSQFSGKICPQCQGTRTANAVVHGACVRACYWQIIRQSVRPRGITTSHLCVLDDISRAPGEALNVLLRLLNERKYGNEPIPLLCAVATGNPAIAGSYVEPLDPANVDRFIIQVPVFH